MAQSQMNLTIGIGVDQGKLDADIRIAKAKMQDLAKTANAAAKEAVKTGDRAAADAASTAFARQDQVLRGLTNQKKAFVAATTQSTNALVRETKAGGEYIRYLLEFGRAAGITTVKVRDLRLGIAGLVASEVVKNIADAVKNLNELNSTAREIGTTPQRLKALQTAFENAGEGAAKAAILQGTYNKRWDETKLKAVEAGKVIGGVDILRGGGTEGAIGTIGNATTVLKGGQQATLDWSRSIEMTGGKLKDQNVDFREAAKQILAETDALKANKAAMENFGLPLATIRPILKQIAEGTLTEGDAPTAKAAEALKTYNETTTKIKSTWDEINQAVAINAVNIAVATSKAETYNATIRARLADPTMGELPFTASPRGQEVVVPVPPLNQQSGGYISGPGSGTSDSILARLSNGEFVINAASARKLGVGYLNRLNRFAGGGFAPDYDPDRPGYSISSLYQATQAVNQPGVPWGSASRGIKRLVSPRGGAEQFGPVSPSEMIKRLREILIGGWDPSRFSLGGLVGAAPFAAGGLVSASSSSGRPVHLHLGSSSFALSGSSGVVDALVSHAHGQQMRSAGVKPSWFAGRPGGR